MDDLFKKRLERWRRELVDTTKRNRLLNYKPNKRTTVRIDGNQTQAVYQRLLVSGKALKVLSLSEHTSFSPEEQDSLTLEGSSTSHLYSSLAQDDLDQNLLAMFRKASSFLEEQGFSPLFLSLGMLRWYESDDSDIELLAPLILIPVELTRKTAKSDFSVRATKDEPVLNPALIEKLSIDFRANLPPLPEDLEDLITDDFFEIVRETVGRQKRWRVTPEIYLDFFSFQKFLMYKDMERFQEVYSENRLIQTLCSASGQPAPISSFSDNVDLDAALLPESTFHVLDADSSQQKAILAVKSKQDLVIEGPPGTGKSQTIANIIADSLADGKTVLFVSEKMAALQVVYKRLEALELHDFCLELHSHNTNKKAVYSELDRVLNIRCPSDHRADSDLRQLREVRDSLNQYVKELHTPIGDSEETPFLVLGELAHLQEAPIVKASIPGIDLVTPPTFRRAVLDVRELASILEEVGDPLTHPWNGSRLTKLSAYESGSLRKLIADGSEAVKALDKKVAAFAIEIGAVQPKAIGQVQVLCEAALAVANCPRTSEAVLANPRWNSMPAEARELISNGSQFSELRQETFSKFGSKVLDQDVSLPLERLSKYAESWTRVCKSTYWRERSTAIRLLGQNYKPASIAEMIHDLNEVLECQSLRKYLDDRETLARELFGERWNGADSNWQELSRFSEWVVNLRQFVIGDCLNSKAIVLAANGGLELGQTQEIVELIKSINNCLIEYIHEVIKVAEFPQEWSRYASPGATIVDISAWLNRLQSNFDHLDRWVAFQSCLSRCLKGPAGPLVSTFIEERLNPSLLEAAFLRLYYETRLQHSLSKRQRLSDFSSFNQEQQIKQFRDLDMKSIKLARQRLLFKLHSKRLFELAKPELTGELQALKRETRKKTRHAALRKLFSRASKVINHVKPCFMMSPLSAAQFLDPKFFTFDLVVFDEASQIPTADAVGSLARAKQAVVVGDPKQLPPTDFFQSQISQEDLDQSDIDTLPEVESVLDEFICRDFARRQLQWHYRSKHESLIEFSNRHFYKNLLTFPSPHQDTEELGLKFQFVGGIYQGSGVNRVEATVVADAVCAHIKSTPHLSLGVGTFNVAQKELIMDELDRRRRADPSLEFFFEIRGEDQFFVKNLENIQGDERDVIFISITYGPDEHGKVNHFFGPLNGENGWRRLNVLFTRAKLSMKVFSSMRGEQIDPTRAKSFGARTLRDFLLFAEKGIAEAPTVYPEAVIESPLERDVFNALTRQGIRLQPQVGQSGYRIDFGVVDETMPGRFIAGIECDGVTYHSAATARDRDRLRQGVLEHLGWTIIRIWSSDWNRNKKSQVDRVMRQISDARRKVQDDARQRSEKAPEEKLEITSVITYSQSQPTPANHSEAGGAKHIAENTTTKSLSQTISEKPDGRITYEGFVFVQEPDSKFFKCVNDERLGGLYARDTWKATVERLLRFDSNTRQSVPNSANDGNGTRAQNNLTDSRA